MCVYLLSLETEAGDLLYLRSEFKSGPLSLPRDQSVADNVSVFRAGTLENLLISDVHDTSPQPVVCLGVSFRRVIL